MMSEWTDEEFKKIREAARVAYIAIEKMGLPFSCELGVNPQAISHALIIAYSSVCAALGATKKSAVCQALYVLEEAYAMEGEPDDDEIKIKH